MRILHVYTGNLYGGLETVLIHIARTAAAFPKVDARFALCFAGQLLSELKALGITPHMLHPAKLSRPWSVWRARRTLIKLLNDEKWDLVICHSPWPLAVFGPAVRQSGCRLVFWTHQYLTGKGFDEKLARRCRPDMAICCSEFTARSMDVLFPNLPTTVVYNPFRIPVTKGDDAVLRRLARAEFQTPEDAVVVLQASRLEWWKGQRLHLQALARLRELPDWVLWLAGGVQRPHEQRYLLELKELASKLGIEDRIRFLGHRRDIPRLLIAADIVCHPNESPEHFGVAFIEGLAAAKPVIATKMGGALEIVNSSCGILSDDNPTAVAAALETLIRNPAQRASLGANGPARVRELCDPERNLSRLYDLFRTQFMLPN